MAAAPPAPDSDEPRGEWEDLTLVCLLNVLSRLSLEDRWKGASLVCKPWLLASRDPSFFTTFDLEPRFDSSRDPPLWWTPEFERKIDSMLRSAAECGDVGLVEVRVRHCSDRALLVLAERYVGTVMLRYQYFRWLLELEHEISYIWLIYKFLSKPRLKL